MIYLFNIGSLFIYSLLLRLIKLNRINRNKLLLFLFFFQLLIIHGLKNPDCFNDTPEYAQGFKEICWMDFSDYLVFGTIKAEIGYSFFMKLVSYISNNEQTIFVATSLVIVGCYIKAIKDYSMIPWMSIFLFLIGGFNQSMYVLRQHMAIAILLLSFPYILKRKFWMFLLINILACSIHLTAIVFFPIYFIYKISLSKRNLILLFLIGIILRLIFNNTVVFIVGYLGIYSAYMDPDLAGTNLKVFILLLGILCCCLVYMKKDYTAEGINKLLIMILIVGTIIQGIGIGNPITGRLNMYYSNIIFLIFPNMLFSITNKNMRYLFALTFLLFLSYFYLMNLQSMESYKFFWEL